MTNSSLIQAITFSGPSGSGKSATARALLNRCSEIELAQGYTTRSPREDELNLPVEYREYRYISDSEFDERDKKGEFIWKIERESGRYATSRTLFETHYEGTLLFLVTPDIVSRIHALATGYVKSFFFFPPPPEEIVRRMRLRGDDEITIHKLLVDSRKPQWLLPLRDGSIDWIPIITEKRDVVETVDEICDYLHV